MDFKYSPNDVSGFESFRRFVERCPTHGTSARFDRVFTDIQEYKLRYRWSLVVKNLLPVTDPNNEPEAFLVCNAIRHIDCTNHHPSGTNFIDWERRCVRNFDKRIPESAFFRDFRHFAFAKVARRYPDTILAEFCRIVTEPHPRLVGMPECSIFYSGLGD